MPRVPPPVRSPCSAGGAGIDGDSKSTPLRYGRVPEPASLKRDSKRNADGRAESKRMYWDDSSTSDSGSGSIGGTPTNLPGMPSNVGTARAQAEASEGGSKGVVLRPPPQRPPRERAQEKSRRGPLRQCRTLPHEGTPPQQSRLFRAADLMTPDKPSRFRDDRRATADNKGPHGDAKASTVLAERSTEATLRLPRPRCRLSEFLHIGPGWSPLPSYPTAEAGDERFAERLRTAVEVLRDEAVEASLKNVSWVLSLATGHSPTKTHLRELAPRVAGVSLAKHGGKEYFVVDLSPQRVTVAEESLFPLHRPAIERSIAAGGWAHMDDLQFEELSMAVWLRLQADELAALSLGQALQLLRACRAEQLIGKRDGHYVPYRESHDFEKITNAAQHVPTNLREGERYISSWATLAKCLRILCAESPASDGIQVSHLKHMFRDRFNAELSETAFGCMTLSELVRSQEVQGHFSIKSDAHSMRLLLLPDTHLGQGSIGEVDPDDFPTFTLPRARLPSGDDESRGVEGVETIHRCDDIGTPKRHPTSPASRFNPGGVLRSPPFASPSHEFDTIEKLTFAQERLGLSPLPSWCDFRRTFIHIPLPRCDGDNPPLRRSASDGMMTY